MSSLLMFKEKVQRSGLERADCFALFVFLVSRDCCVALPHNTIVCLQFCDCGMSLSYSLTTLKDFKNASPSLNPLFHKP